LRIVLSFDSFKKLVPRATVREQAMQIQKVSAQVEMSRLRRQWSSTISKAARSAISYCRPSADFPMDAGGHDRA
jgi:hypothetical protein